ncbi:MAG TPA: hypothetical protein VFA21_21585 [Pyrinomonadaceae bacterium]|nr:hypothetical protein [Pyrinomonadaceae bacterium]
MPGPKATRLLVRGAFVALLGLAFLLEALRRMLPAVMPRSGGVGTVAGSGILIQLASTLVLLLAGVVIALFAVLRGGRPR